MTINLIILAGLLLLSAFFSGSETAYFSLSRFDVQRMVVRRRHGAKAVDFLLSRPGRLLIAILVGNMVVNVAAASLMTAVFLELVGPGGVPLAVVVMTILILIFGEITPKVIAVEHNELWTRFAWPLIKGLIFLTAPVGGIVERLEKLFLGKIHEEDMRLGEVDIESALEIAYREGAIGEQARDLLRHFLALDYIKAEDIMLHRTEVPFLDPNTPTEKVREFFRQPSNDFALVLSEKHTVGTSNNRAFEEPMVLERRKALLSSEDDVFALAERPVFVPVTRALGGLFDDIRLQGSRYVVVVDEHGDIAGVIPRDRILSSIFGEPLLERKLDLKRVSKIGEFYLIAASMSLDDFNIAFNSSIESKHYSTLGGYLTEVFGYVPQRGELIERDGFLFRIIRAGPKVIDRVAVKRVEDK